MKREYIKPELISLGKMLPEMAIGCGCQCGGSAGAPPGECESGLNTGSHINNNCHSGGAAGKHCKSGSMVS